MNISSTILGTSIMPFFRVSNQFSSSRKTKFFAFCSLFKAHIITFSYGCIIGWVSNAIAHLMSVQSSLAGGPITVEEASWIGSIICLGSIIGSISFGYVCAIIGSKRAMCLITIPAVLHWLTIIFGNTVLYLYLARIIAGWVGGTIQHCGLIYVAEISDSR